MIDGDEARDLMRNYDVRSSPFLELETPFTRWYVQFERRRMA